MRLSTLSKVLGTQRVMRTKPSSHNSRNAQHAQATGFCPHPVPPGSCPKPPGALETGQLRSIFISWANPGLPAGNRAGLAFLDEECETQRPRGLDSYINVTRARVSWIPIHSPFCSQRTANIVHPTFFQIRNPTSPVLLKTTRKRRRRCSP